MLNFVMYNIYEFHEIFKHCKGRGGGEVTQTLQLKAVFHLDVFHTCIHAHKSLNQFQYYI